MADDVKACQRGSLLPLFRNSVLLFTLCLLGVAVLSPVVLPLTVYVPEEYNSYLEPVFAIMRTMRALAQKSTAAPTRPAATGTPRSHVAAASHRQASAASCGAHTDSCGLGGGPPSNPFAGHTLHQAASAPVRGPQPAHAQAETSTAAKSEWWNKDKDLWIEVHTEEDFRREVSDDTLS